MTTTPMYTVTCESCEAAFQSPEPYASPHVRPLCPTCDALARNAAYVSPGERQAAALERIAAALEKLLERPAARGLSSPYTRRKRGSPYDAGGQR